MGLSYDEDDLLPLLDRIKAGEPLRTVALEAGVDRTTLSKYFKRKYGVNKLKPRGIPPPGTTHKPVANQTNVAAPADYRAPPPSASGSCVLVIGDLHCPFQHIDALEFLKLVRDTYHTNLTISLGDEIDAHAFSRYMPDPDGMTPGKELSLAIEALRPFYREFPDMLVCESNHTVRPWKKAFDAGLPQAFLPTYSQLLDAPDGWRWAGRHCIDGTLYIHGDNGRSGQYAHIHYVKQAKQSVVIGHIHGFAGVNYEAEHFGMNAGCLIDEAAYCFKYAKNMLVKVNLGCGVVLEGKYALFIPMRVDQHNRWIGRL